MVENVPSPEDFYVSGKELLNFAWDATASLLIEFDHADYYVLDESDMAEVSEKYWAAAKRTLTTALTVIQQAVELIIKGRIAEVSPYLLISDAPARWPSPYEGKPVNFERFRTIDAQDLIRVHDTFTPTPFGAGFVQKFQSLRDVRNVVMHSAGKNVTVQAAEVVDSALYMHKSLFPAERWFTVRREFLRSAPGSELGAAEFATNHVCLEATIVKKLLQPAEVLTYIGVDKKRRSYICPSCLHDANTDGGFDYKLAVLQSKGAEATDLYCPICDRTHLVRREACQDADCKGNVMSTDFGRCLSCGNWQDAEDDLDSN